MKNKKSKSTDIKTLKTTTYKTGYQIKNEIWDGKTEMRVAYNLNGDYIGSPKDAYFLCVKKGIAPEKSKPDHCVCSIGFSKKDGKWYGWSHRAIFGFKKGSRVKIGDCGFKPKNQKQFIESLKEWHEKILKHKNVTYKSSIDGIVDVKWDAKDGQINGVIEKYPEKWGKGEWIAKNLNDAKQMAIDFASGVS